MPSGDVADVFVRCSKMDNDSEPAHQDSWSRPTSNSVWSNTNPSLEVTSDSSDIALPSVQLVSGTPARFSLSAALSQFAAIFKSKPHEKELEPDTRIKLSLSGKSVNDDIPSLSLSIREEAIFADKALRGSIISFEEEEEKEEEEDEEGKIVLWPDLVSITDSPVKNAGQDLVGVSDILFDAEKNVLSPDLITDYPVIDEKLMAHDIVEVPDVISVALSNISFHNFVDITDIPVVCQKTSVQDLVDVPALLVTKKRIPVVDEKILIIAHDPDEISDVISAAKRTHVVTETTPVRNLVDIPDVLSAAENKILGEAEINIAQDVADISDFLSVSMSKTHSAPEKTSAQGLGHIPDVLSAAENKILGEAESSISQDLFDITNVLSIAEMQIPVVGEKSPALDLADIRDVLSTAEKKVHSVAEKTSAKNLVDVPDVVFVSEKHVPVAGEEIIAKDVDEIPDALSVVEMRNHVVTEKTPARDLFDASFAVKKSTGVADIAQDLDDIQDVLSDTEKIPVVKKILVYDLVGVPAVLSDAEKKIPVDAGTAIPYLRLVSDTDETSEQNLIIQDVLTAGVTEKVLPPDLVAISIVDVKNTDSLAPIAAYAISQVEMESNVTLGNPFLGAVIDICALVARSIYKMAPLEFLMDIVRDVVLVAFLAFVLRQITVKIFNIVAGWIPEFDIYFHIDPLFLGHIFVFLGVFAFFFPK